MPWCQTVSDRRFQTNFVKEKAKLYKYNVANSDKSAVLFDLGRLAEATHNHVGRTMEAKRGDGMIFVNCMEKLTMNAPRETLRVRLSAALDAGIDGITLSAGLHLGSFALIAGPSALSRCQARHHRLVAAGAAAVPAQERQAQPAARLHHGGGPACRRAPRLRHGLGEVRPAHDRGRDPRSTCRPRNWTFRSSRRAGSSPAATPCRYLESGAAAVQVATRFTATRECGLPDKVKQEYFKASEDDIEVNMISPTGYPMRMLKSSPAIGAGIRPNCEAYGYLLDGSGNCAYITAYNREVAAHPDGEEDLGEGQDLPVHRHAQFRLLDLRALHLPAQGHLAPPAGRQLPVPERGARVSRLPVQHRPEDRAAAQAVSCLIGRSPPRVLERLGVEEQATVSAVDELPVPAGSC